MLSLKKLEVILFFDWYLLFLLILNVLNYSYNRQGLDVKFFDRKIRDRVYICFNKNNWKSFKFG